MLTGLMYAFTGFTIGLSGALMPGPLLFYTLTQVTKGEKWVAVKVIGGHIIAEVIVVLLLVFGLAPLIQSPDLVRILGISGGIVLVFMGIYTCLSAKNQKISSKKQVNFAFGPILGGFFFSIFNPGFPIWWASVGSTYILKTLNMGVVIFLSFMIGHWLSDLGWYAAVVTTTKKGLPLMSDRIFQNCVRVLGLLLAGFGVFFIFGG